MLMKPITHIPTDDYLEKVAIGIPNAYIVEVTPEMAARWLDANTDNRPLRKGVVEKYAETMTAGEWSLTHQGVAFSNERLIDGQHRLAAVVAANIPVRMVVFAGCNDAAFGVLDRGEKRSVRDDLRDDKRIIDPCSYISRLVHGKADAFSVKPIFQAIGPTLQDILDAAGSNPTGRGGASIRAAVALRLVAAGEEDSQYLLEQWRAWIGLDVSAMSPAVGALLRRLENLKATGGNGIQHERAACAWLAFRPDQRDISRILIRDHDNVMSEIREAAEKVIA